MAPVIPGLASLLPRFLSAGGGPLGRPPDRSTTPKVPSPRRAWSSPARVARLGSLL